MEKATEAREKDKQGTELEAIKLAVVNSVASGLDGLVDTTALKTGLAGLIQENPEDVIVGNGPWTVTSPSGRVYEINKNSTVNEVTGLILTPKSLTLTIEGETYEEKIITARLIDIEGTISWSESTDKIDITPSEDGMCATIKAKKAGTETITVSCSNGDTSICTVKIENNKPPIGEYVDYAVSYKDMYSDYLFNSTNGWRILNPGTKTIVNGVTEYSGTKIVSTGVPGILNYQSWMTGTWWGNTGNKNAKAIYGMKYNFKSIPFVANTSPSVNKVGYKSITNSNPTDITNTANGSIFITNKAVINDDTITTGDTQIESIHVITLEELNIARSLNATSITSTATTDGATGLFYLANLANENSAYLYTTSTNYYYWLSSRYGTSVFNVEYMNYSGEFGGLNGTNDDYGTYGIRPVITLNSNIYKEGDIWKIR